MRHQDQAILAFCLFGASGFTEERARDGFFIEVREVKTIAFK